MVVEITEYSISILDKNFKEIVYWEKDEWEEDGDVVLSIANAIRIYYTNGEKELKDILRVK